MLHAHDDWMIYEAYMVTLATDDGHLLRLDYV